MSIFRFTTGINISYQGDGEEAQVVDRADMAWRACQVAGAGKADALCWRTDATSSPDSQTWSTPHSLPGCSHSSAVHQLEKHASLWSAHQQDSESSVSDCSNIGSVSWNQCFYSWIHEDQCWGQPSPHGCIFQPPSMLAEPVFLKKVYRVMWTVFVFMTSMTTVWLQQSLKARFHILIRLIYF